MVSQVLLQYSTNKATQLNHPVSSETLTIRAKRQNRGQGVIGNKHERMRKCVDDWIGGYRDSELWVNIEGVRHN